MKKFKQSGFITSLLLLSIMILNSSCTKNNHIDDSFNYAKTRMKDLKLSIYITAHTVDRLLTTEAGKREAISIFRANGATKAYIEVYRSGLIIDKLVLEDVRDFFLKNDIQVVGGIATVPGGDFGVKQEGTLGWFNWQNSKTQSDLKEVMKMSASVFDEFIVDDFLCTADTSLESKAAKGDRSWSQYRRDLLTELSEEIFIKPAKDVNPDIKIIIKYPQWYDRFHLFGYELAKEPQLFDKVWVGTESRGQYTQRYGFVQPYEGFVNYRWIKDIAKEKIGGAWFDHGDCDADDFVEQAYQSVLAGAKEIVLFNYYNFVQGHSGHHLLRSQFEKLADLAKSVSLNPAVGVIGYKPVNSDAGGDLYIMDFIGSLGVPIIPVSEYPTNSDVVFLPTQAAADKDIYNKINASLEKGSTVIFTTGFLANAENSRKLTRLAGILYPVISDPLKVEKGILGKQLIDIEHGLDLEARIIIGEGEQLLSGYVESKQIPFLVKSNKAKIFTINSHTFDQEDFDRVGEVLLCPKQLGLLEIPREWANKVRKTFTEPLGISIDAPTRIAVQQLGSSGLIIHNFNKSEHNIIINSEMLRGKKIIDGFTNEELIIEGNTFSTNLKPRSRQWIKLN